MNIYLSFFIIKIENAPHILIIRNISLLSDYLSTMYIISFDMRR
jgi:hypothetical protein